MTKIIKFGGRLLNHTINEIINYKEFQGIQWSRFPELNKSLKGFRPGELTVFSGKTGVGKTTFLCEYSLDLCENGVNTLWGSFEMPLRKICKTMLEQFSGEPLRDLQESKTRDWATSFCAVPLFFMDMHGSQSEQRVFDIMHEGVKTHQVQHIVIDNLQFMLGSTGNTFEDKFQRQDRFVGKLRAFATETNCHVTVVAHPRKENKDDLITMNSIYGGAKLTQESDNVMALQEETASVVPRKYVEILKNRYDGQLGRIDLKFNRERTAFRPQERKLIAYEKEQFQTLE